MGGSLESDVGDPLRIETGGTLRPIRRYRAPGLQCRDMLGLPAEACVCRSLRRIPCLTAQATGNPGARGSHRARHPTATTLLRVNGCSPADLIAALIPGLASGHVQSGARQTTRPSVPTRSRSIPAIRCDGTRSRDPSPAPSFDHPDVGRGRWSVVGVGEAVGRRHRRGVGVGVGRASAWPSVSGVGRRLSAWPSASASARRRRRGRRLCRRGRRCRRRRRASAWPSASAWPPCRRGVGVAVGAA